MEKIEKKSRIPLFRLPENVMDKVVKTMGMLEIVAFSLCSEATRSLVASFNWRVEPAEWSRVLLFEKAIEIGIGFLNNTSLHLAFYDDVKDAPLRKKFALRKNGRRNRLVPLRTPKTVDVVHFNRGETNKAKWKFSRKEGLSFGDWARHMLSIFDNGKMFEIQFSPGSERFYLKDIKRNLGDMPEDAYIFVDDNCPDGFHKKVHRTFQPISSLQLSRNPYREAPHLLCQNFNALVLRDSNPFTLDDLLLTNALTLETHKPRNLTVKDVRRFIKCWINGMTSRRTFYIHIKMMGRVVLSANTVLQGIEYSVVAKDEVRYNENFQDEHVIRGGYDVCARDGRKATITFARGAMNFYVW